MIQGAISFCKKDNFIYVTLDWLSIKSFLKSLKLTSTCSKCNHGAISLERNDNLVFIKLFECNIKSFEKSFNNILDV